MTSPQRVHGNRVAVARVTLYTTRVLWAALIAGQVAAAIVFAIILNQGDAPEAPRAIRTPAMIADGAILLVGVVVTIVLRSRGMRGLEGEAAIRRRYLRNTLVPMAVLEASGLLGLVLVLLIGRPYPAGIVPLASLVVQLLLYPRATHKA